MAKDWSANTFFSKYKCMCIVATLHLLNASCKITQHILLPIFLDFISSPGGIISFNISGFLKKGQEIHLKRRIIRLD